MASLAKNRRVPLTEQELIDIWANSDEEEILDGNPENEPMEDDGWCNLSDSDDDDDENELPKVENEVFDGGKSDSNDMGDDENGDSNVSIPNKRHKVTYNASFKWKKQDLHPILHDFDNNNSGCNIPNMEENPSILEIFEMFITRDFVENSQRNQ
ncbi:hypothetical protein QE152_g29906 [Popillia japonica]|uniref:PiggyBac transposable element-derived protein domain-containing protein n=1 Tax=Popillia japonica TaxID=7064 RepID=A0AAW1JFV3_POPJA